MLKEIKDINRQLNFVDIQSTGFTSYGTYLGSTDWKNLAKEADTLIDREATPAYIASIPELERLTRPSSLNEVFAEDVQIGICRGDNSSLNGMEWHDCPEILVAVSPLVLLLGLQDELSNGSWDSGNAKACYLEEGEAVSLHEGTLHLAPCRTGKEPFLSLIILPRGVNGELDGNITRESKDLLLWKVRKWILSHRDSPQAAKGAPIGISGPNLELHTL